MGEERSDWHDEARSRRQVFHSFLVEVRLATMTLSAISMKKTRRKSQEK